MHDEDIYDDIRLTKRKTITYGAKYDFYIYNMLALEKIYETTKIIKHAQGTINPQKRVIPTCRVFKPLVCLTQWPYVPSYTINLMCNVLCNETVDKH